jgi:ATP/maltotriose-dependent transcriptional regulator MalT
VDAAVGSPAYRTLSARLDELQRQRYTDPTGTLAQMREARQGWPAMEPAEEALMRARFAMQVAGTCTVLGLYQQALPEFEAMDTHLREPALQAAGAPMQGQALRCEAAGSNARAIAVHALGDLAGALRAYLHALDLARALDDARYQAHVLVNLANTYEESGLPAEALDQLRQALVLAEAEGMEELVGDIHHNMGNALAAVGEREAGLASNRRALERYTTLALPQKERYALVALAERLLELGRLDEAQAALADRARRSEDFTNHQYEAYAEYLSGRIAVAQARPAAAREALGRARSISANEVVDPVGRARAGLELARLSMAEQDWDEAQQFVSQALVLLQPTSATRDQMQAHQLAYEVARARGDAAAALGHHEHFHAAYARCINGESSTKARLLAVRHEADLVQAEAQRARMENARLSEALAEISARLAGARAGATARLEAPEPASLRALGLTPREAEVLYWVAQGKTNEDVADILGASQSTVKKHLLKVFDKLGVQNRTAAANMARQHGALPRLSGGSTAP